MKHLHRPKETTNNSNGLFTNSKKKDIIFTVDKIRFRVLKEFYKGAVTIIQKMVYDVKGKIK